MSYVKISIIFNKLSSKSISLLYKSNAIIS